MGIGQILANTGTFILNRGLGLVTRRQARASALTLGRRLYEASQRQQGNMSKEMLTSIFQASVPKGVKIPPIVTTQEALQAHISQVATNDVAAALSQHIAGNGAAAFVTSKKPVFYLPERLLSTPEPMVVGTTHEFTHFLDFEAINPLKFIKKLVPKKVTSAQTKGSMKIQEKYMKIQQRLASDLGITTPLKGAVPQNTLRILETSKKKVVGYFRKLLKSQMRDLSPKERKKFLFFIKYLNSSEARAYTNSGQVGRLFDALGKDKIHSSELLGKYQELFLEAVAKERKALKIAKKSGYKTIKAPKTKRHSFRYHGKTQYYTVEKGAYVERPKAVLEIEKEVHESRPKKIFNVVMDEVIPLKECKKLLAS